MEYYFLTGFVLGVISGWTFLPQPTWAKNLFSFAGTQFLNFGSKGLSLLVQYLKSRSLKK